MDWVLVSTSFFVLKMFFSNSGIVFSFPDNSFVFLFDDSGMVSSFPYDSFVFLFVFVDSGMVSSFP